MWFKKKAEWWRNGLRSFSWKDNGDLLAEKAYESYTSEFYRVNRFATTTHVDFHDLPSTAKEVWRKTAEDIARWTLIMDSGRSDLD